MTGDKKAVYVDDCDATIPYTVEPVCCEKGGGGSKMKMVGKNVGRRVLQTVDVYDPNLNSRNWIRRVDYWTRSGVIK